MEWTTSTILEPDLPPVLIIEEDDDIEVVITERVEKKAVPPVKITPPQPIAPPIVQRIIVKKPDEPIDPVVIPDSVLYPDDGDYGDGDDTTVYAFLPAEHMPKFGKGETDLLNYLGGNIKYPEMARAARVSGIVYVTFVVNKKGAVVDPKILRGIGSGCDKEALRVVSNMPKWKPGRQRGKRVAVQFTLPVKYELR